MLLLFNMVFYTILTNNICTCIDTYLVTYCCVHCVREFYILCILDYG